MVRDCALPSDDLDFSVDSTWYGRFWNRMNVTAALSGEHWNLRRRGPSSEVPSSSSSGARGSWTGRAGGGAAHVPKLDAVMAVAKVGGDAAAAETTTEDADAHAGDAAFDCDADAVVGSHNAGDAVGDAIRRVNVCAATTDV